MRLLYGCVLAVSITFLFSTCATKNDTRDGARRVEILFLGHNSEHHNSVAYLPLLAAQLSKEGINFTYSDSPSILNREALASFDGLMIYAITNRLLQTRKRRFGFCFKWKGFHSSPCASFVSKLA